MVVRCCWIVVSSPSSVIVLPSSASWSWNKPTRNCTWRWSSSVRVLLPPVLDWGLDLGGSPCPSKFDILFVSEGGGLFCWNTCIGKDFLDEARRCNA